MKTSQINLLVAAGLLLASAIGVALAAPPLPSPNQVNSGGITLSDLSTESHAGGVQANPAGAVVTVDGSFDASADTANGAGITAYTGRIDPDFRGRNAAGIIWMTEPGLAK